LGHRNLDGMKKIFAPGSKVVTDKGAENAIEYFKGYLGELEASKVEEEEVLCEAGAQKLPKMTVIFTHTSCSSKDTRKCYKETVLGVFQFVSNHKDSVLKLNRDTLSVSEVVMYHNDYANEMIARAAEHHDAGMHDGHTTDKSYTAEARNLAEGFLHALAIKDKGSFLNLFTEDGKVLSPVGLMPANKFFTFMESFDAMHINQGQLFCDSGAKMSTTTICFAIDFGFGSAHGGVGRVKQHIHDGRLQDSNGKDHLCAHFLFKRNQKFGTSKASLQLDFVVLFENSYGSTDLEHTKARTGKGSDWEAHWPSRENQFSMEGADRKMSKFSWPFSR